MNKQQIVFWALLVSIAFNVIFIIGTCNKNGKGLNIPVDTSLILKIDSLQKHYPLREKEIIDSMNTLQKKDSINEKEIKQVFKDKYIRDSIVNTLSVLQLQSELTIRFGK